MSCPKINKIAFSNNIIPIGENVQISFTLQPLGIGDCPSNDKFNFEGIDGDDKIVYSASNITSNVENKYEFLAGTAGVFSFSGIAYGNCSGSIFPGPKSGNGELKVVKIHEIIVDSSAELMDETKALYAATRTQVGEAEQFLDVLAVFYPNISVEEIPDSFTFTGGLPGETIDFRKASRKQPQSLKFVAKLGTSSFVLGLDIVDIDRILICDNNIGVESEVTITTRPAGYEDKVSVTSDDAEGLEVYKKDDEKWYSKGLKTGNLTATGKLTLADETFERIGHASVCDVKIKGFRYALNLSLVPTDYSIGSATHSADNHYKIPATKRVIYVVAYCDYGSIEAQVDDGVLPIVVANGKIKGGGMDESRTLGINVGIDTSPGSGGGSVYSNNVMSLQPVLVLGTGKATTNVKSCGEQKVVDERNYEIISYDQWTEVEKPTITFTDLSIKLW